MTENPAEKGDDLQKARGVALARLARREHSEWEIRRILSQKGFSEEIIDSVARELLASDYLNESRYIEAVVSDQVLKGKGARAVQVKLSQKGVKADTALLESLLEKRSGESSLQRAREIVSRRYPGCMSADCSEAEKNRAYQALLRRGFSFDTARRAIRSFVDFRDTDTEA